MTTYSAIANSEIDPDSPITTGLMTKLRDNPISLAEGGSGSPGISFQAMNYQEFTSSGTFNVPSTVSKVMVECVGGGGGGGGSTGYGGSGEGYGGGNGGYVKGIFTVTPSGSISVTVGSGGSKGSSLTSNGSSGGTSSFGSYCSATGGTGGSYSAAATPGVGGHGVGAFDKYRGSNGSQPGGGRAIAGDYYDTYTPSVYGEGGKGSQSIGGNGQDGYQGIVRVWY